MFRFTVIFTDSQKFFYICNDTQYTIMHLIVAYLCNGHCDSRDKNNTLD